MPKKSCCCGAPSRSCCNPELFNEFITLIGGTMLTANPVNINDLILLTVKRPGVQKNPTIIAAAAQNTDGCGNGCMNP